MTLLDRLLGRDIPTKAQTVMPLGVRNLEVKAVTGPGADIYSQEPLLSSLLSIDPQQKCAAFLKAYKVGWFYKAERKISTDIASLDWTISDGDIESDDPNETIIPKPDLDIDFADLNPIEQLIRLLERPNPWQTGKTLLQKTQIRRDMAGAAFWYLEGGDGGALPTAIFGISPARMWPSYGKRGELIGWVMDRNRIGGGIPFTPDEILAFPMPSADQDTADAFGVGVVEAVYAYQPVGELIARHASDVLTTGGRLAGMLSPKDRSLDEDEYQDTLRAWRNVASDPNAARRLLVFPEPMEWQSGAANPKDIGLPDLAALNRDEILTAFPIAPEMLGVPMPAGLNASGESRKEIRSEYWGGTIHPRVDDIEEVVQINLVSRYEQAMGQTFDFDFDEPDMDDAASLMEKVAAFKALVGSGFDPTEARAAAALDHIKYLAVPSMLDPVAQAQMQQQAQAAQAQALTATVTEGNRGARVSESQPVVKALKAGTNREAIAAAGERHGKSIMETFFFEQKQRVADKLRASLPKTKAARKADSGDWWDAEAEDAALEEALAGFYVTIGRGGLQVVADQLNRIVTNSAVKKITADLLSYGGARITEINEGTRLAISEQLATGATRGYSINQLIDGVPDEKYAGVQNALLDNGIPAFDSYRAEMIARTETALSYNRAAISGYSEFGVKEVQALDGDYDEVCAERNGRTFSIADAYGIQDHPNGTLDWAPVL